MTDYRDEYRRWCEDSYFDDKTRQELKALTSEEEIKDRFSRELEFGTGGLRGIMGAGLNRMNRYTVRKATQGLANYINSQERTERKAVIAYDSRHMSPEFAQIAGLVLAGNGIPAYVYPALRPTPMLSFAVRELGCTAGIVITASHNPPEYNGYKVYWADGAQVVAPRDKNIIQEVNAVSSFGEIKEMDLKEAQKAGLFSYIGQEIDDAYDANVLAQCQNKALIAKMADDLKIVYTPIHGSGNLPVRRALEKAGFHNVYIVKEQEQPDADFTTVGYPNPEDPKVFTLAKALAEEVGADIIVGTDPDCDRVGAMVRNDKGEFVVLTGNMTGALLTEYILSQKKANATLPDNGVVIKTIVSTELIAPICKAYHVEEMEVLTGFKFIGEKIKTFEETGSHTFLFGFEESYGCLAGTYARDKDAVVATLLICEMAAYYKQKGMTLYDGLQKLYETYGCYQDNVKAITLKGLDGVEKIQAIMESFRKDIPKTFAGIDVVLAKDYKTQTIKNMQTGEETKSTLPPSDVVYYTLADGSWICVRPSGTEPKLKFYIGVKGDTMAEAKAKADSLEKDIDTKIEQV